MKLSIVAEKQIVEIQYALGCSKANAINHALESQHAFESITDDQIFNWLDTYHKDQLEAWRIDNKDKVSKTPSN